MDDSEKLAFWGIALKPGEPAELDLEDGETLHVSMASFGVELADKHGRSVVTATISNSEDAGESEKRYALSALTAGKTETVCMDVSFIGEESVTFEVTGKNVVHLVGNFSFENDVDDDSDDDNDGANLIGVYDDDSDMSDDEEEEDEMPRLIMDKDPPVITELSDDDDQPAKDKKAVIVKKKAASSSKVANGKHTEPISKKDAKAGAGKASKASAKTAQKKMKVDEPLLEDEEESEEESGEESEEEDEEGSEDLSDDEDEVVKGKPGKHVKGAISDDDEDDSDTTDEDESESENKEEELELRQALLESMKKQLKGGKPSVVFKEVPSRSARDEDKITPNSAKTKRQRKRGVSLGASDGVTPPQSKKSKISERPGTPAPSKSGHKGKSSGSATRSRSGGKGATPNAAGSSSAKKLANGVPNSALSTPSPKDSASTPAGGGTPGKRRRRKARKGRDSS